MNNFYLHILAAQRSFYEGECQSLVVPITDGLYGIQANHKNMVAAIVPGFLEFTLPDQKRMKAKVSQGILIVADNDVRLLVDTVETEDEVEINRLQRAVDEAKEIELQKKSVQEFKSATIWIARENSRLKRRNRSNDVL